MKNKMMSWWSGPVIAGLTAAMYPPRRHTRIYGFGGLFLAYLVIVWAYLVLKGTAWCMIAGALVALNLTTALVGLIVSPFVYLYYEIAFKVSDAHFKS